MARSPNDGPLLLARFGVLSWLVAAAAFAYLSRNSVAVTEKTMRTELGLTEQQMGWILGPAFFWTYALAQVPTGWWAQRWGSRRTLPAMMLISAGATAAMSWGRDVWSLTLARVAAGIGQAGLFPASVQTIRCWHPPGERALASGALAAAMSIGGAFGVAATGWLLEQQCRWQVVFVLWAAPGLLWAVGFWLWFRDSPAEYVAWRVHGVRASVEVQDGVKSAAVPPEDRPEPVGNLARVLLTSVPLWLIYGQQFFRAAGYAFFTSWFATYLQETRGVTTGQSGMLTMVPLVAIVVSSIVGGAVSDFVYRSTGRVSLARRGVATTSLGLSALLVLATYWIEHTATAITILGIGIFCSGFAGPCAYAASMDLGGKHAALLFSMMNMIGNFGAGLLPWIVPVWRNWWQADVERLQWVGGNSWHAVLWLFAAMYLAAALCWLVLPTSASVFKEWTDRGESTHI